MDEKQFAADLLDFAEENWQAFLAWAAERDYSEADVEEMAGVIRKAAGRV
jgi:hypothetical protein